MTAALRMDKRLTEAEYFAFEERSELRHEFFDGLVFAMVGGTDRPNLIVGDFHTLLNVHLEPPCQVFEQAMKLRIQTERALRHVYPYIMVSCSQADRDSRYRQQPVFLAEVLSNSTEDFDRTDKALLYRSIPSLEEHAIVFQDIPKVELFRRRTAWEPETYRIDDTFHLGSVDLDVPVGRLYRRVFP